MPSSPLDRILTGGFMLTLNVLRKQGRLPGTADLYESLLKVVPEHFDSLYNLGVVRAREGKPEEAVRLFLAAIGEDPNSSKAHNAAGIVLSSLRRYEEAALQFERVLAIEPDSSDGYCNLGIALDGLGRLPEAIACFEKALVKRPDLASAHNCLGRTLQGLNRLDEAVGHYERALAINPNFAEAHNNLGTAAQIIHGAENGIAHFERALAAKPDFAEAHYNLGCALQSVNRIEEAILHFGQAIAINPNFAMAHCRLGVVLQIRNRQDAAVRHYEKALAADPGLAEAHNNLGVALRDLNDAENAIAHFNRAIVLKPDYADAYNNLGNTFTELGRGQEGAAAVEQAVVRAPKRAAFYLSLTHLKRLEADSRHRLAVEELARTMESLSANEQIELHFALGKIHDDSGDYQRAFEHWTRGNLLKRRQVSYDEAATLGLVDRIRSAFTPEQMRRAKGSGDSSHAPVFILGMPRSGTSLVEQVLASHPEVFGAGEIGCLQESLARLCEIDGVAAGFPEIVETMGADQLRGFSSNYVTCVRAVAPPSARLITDKMPANFWLVGLIHLAFPSARIIHTRRDPLDTCFSCYSKLFEFQQPHTYDLGELGRYFRGYHALMEHWRSVLPEDAMLEVRYEEVVADLEGQARRIVGYCGLEWSDECLAFHKTPRSVRTASAPQVHRPIYQTSVGRWRPYSQWLRPLIDALGQDLASGSHSDQA